jgi:hypothetical protein
MLGAPSDSAATTVEPVLRPLPTPPKALVDALVEKLGPEQLKHPGIVKMGGLPRALERFLNAHAKEKEAKRLANAAKELTHTLAFRDKLGLDAPADAGGTVSQAPNFWNGVSAGKTADGHPFAYFRYGDGRPRLMMKHVSEEQLRAVFLDWMEWTLSSQMEASGGSGTATADWLSSVEVHDMAGVGWHNVHVPAIKMSAKVMELGSKHYKDNLAKSFIVNAPGWFGAHACARITHRVGAEMRVRC